ncbi:MAG TPA: DUF3267 domain-containing protein [bacterium]
MKKVGNVKINIYIMSVVAVLIAIGIWFLFFQVLDTPYPQWLQGLRSLVLLPYAIGLVIIHELIHMMTAYLYVPVSSVRLRIKILTWEVSVDKPLRRNRYLLYTFAPGFILSLFGILLYVIFHSSVDVRFFSGILFIFGFAGATGDMFLALGALKYPGTCYIIDRGAELDVLIPESSEIAR